MCALLCFVLAILASPFKSNIRLEAENAALRQHARERRAHARRVVPGARLPPPERGRRVRAVVWPATALRALRPPGRGRAPELEREVGARPSGLPRRRHDWRLARPKFPRLRHVATASARLFKAVRGEYLSGPSYPTRHNKWSCLLYTSDA